MQDLLARKILLCFLSIFMFSISKASGAEKSSSRITLALRTGISFNKAKDQDTRIKPLISHARSKFASTKTKAENSVPIYLDLMYRSESWEHISFGVSAFFISPHRITTIKPVSVTAMLREKSGRNISYTAIKSRGAYRENISVSSIGLMAKVRLQKRISNLSFYVNGGLGTSYNRTKTSTAGVQHDATQKLPMPPHFFTLLGNSVLNFAGQVGAGIKYHINNKFAIDLGYTYLDRGKIYSKVVIDRSADTKGGAAVHLRPKGGVALKHLISHQLLVGFEFNS